jgi:putative transposase
LKIRINVFYKACGWSKQGFHQYLQRRLSQHEECEQMLPVIHQIRKEYPTMSAREMYRIIQPERLGRDRFEAFCFSKGLKVLRKPSYHRTTDSLGVVRFSNLIKDREVKGINQVWVSDITYYRIHDRFYYLTFITDLYSRRILGHSVSKTLFTEETTIPALQMALTNRKGIKPTILHSDGGGQYYCKAFLSLTGPTIANSMGKEAYDNPNAERINGQIKNDYLVHYDPQSFQQLQYETDRAVRNYNVKHHSAIRQSPVEFELLTNSQLSTKEKKNQKKKILHNLNRFVTPGKKVNAIQA